MTSGRVSAGGEGRVGETLADVGEFALIARLVPPVDDAADVLVGPGDDAAALNVNGPIVTSIDALVEGAHFRRDWSSGYDVGRKVVAENVADLEAMGARPVSIVLALCAPADLPVAWVAELMRGAVDECGRAGVRLVGGDMTSAPAITVTGAAIGDLDGRAPVLRSGAMPGQVVALVGRTGWAAAGLVVLRRGFRSPRSVVEAQRCPDVPYGEGRRAAAAGATALIDVSDGLLADLGHIARSSGVVLDIDSSRFSVSEPLQTVAAATGVDPMALLLTGGEDHALVGTFDAGDVPTGWDVVGRVCPAIDSPGVLVDGAPWAGALGWQHFRH